MSPKIDLHANATESMHRRTFTVYSFNSSLKFKDSSVCIGNNFVKSWGMNE